MARLGRRTVPMIAMRSIKEVARISMVVGTAACLAASGAAAADLAAREPPVCRGGILTDALSGTPVFDRTKKDPTPIPCGLPPEEAGLEPLLVGAGVLVVAGALGGCAAAGCWNGHTPPTFPVLPPSTP
jgi:hypothetical protein